MMTFHTMMHRQTQLTLESLLKEHRKQPKDSDIATNENNDQKTTVKDQTSTDILNTNKPATSQTNDDKTTNETKPNNTKQSTPPTDTKGPTKELPEELELKRQPKNDKWVKSMYRKLQKNIHPDRNTSVATEATKIHKAMEMNDIVAALYSYYIYHNDCPIPDEELNLILEKVHNEYMRCRNLFDNKPADIILRSKEKDWNTILDKCVIN